MGSFLKCVLCFVFFFFFKSVSFGNYFLKSVSISKREKTFKHINKHNHSHFGKGKGRKKGRGEGVNEPSKRFQARKLTSMQKEKKEVLPH